MTRPGPGARPSPPLLVDLYELTMAESYIDEGLADTPASFELVCRRLPAGFGYLHAAGIDELVSALAALRFDDEALAYLEASGLFGPALLERLARFRFGGQVRAVPEGSVVFAGEPLVAVTAPMLEAQLIETMALNAVHFPTFVAAKAARCVEAAPGRRLVDFGLRRSHAADAGLRLARGCYLAGFDSTSNVEAGAAYGIPVSGTMAHSYVEAFADERTAFEAFARAYPEGTLLIDTYDTLEGARRAADVALALRKEGRTLGGVRLDSGELLDLSRRVRTLLDEAGLGELAIVASGNLDERAIAALLEAGAPIDGFGVGSRVALSGEAMELDTAYKLVAFGGRPVMKLSSGKQSLPGVKQVWRREDGGRFAGDVIALADEPAPAGARPLLSCVMHDGVPLEAATLERARERAGRERAALPPAHRLLEAPPYPIEIAPGLAELRDRLAAELRAAATGR